MFSSEYTIHYHTNHTLFHTDTVIMPRTSAIHLPILPFLHRFANRLPVFFSWDHVYSKKKAIGQKALRAVSTDTKVLGAAKGGWSAAMIE